MAFESWKERTRELRAEVTALSLALRDDRTPLAAKAVIALVVAYAVSPIDPIPDFVPGLGFLDELVVLPVGVAVALRLVPDDVVAECRERAGEEVAIGRIQWIAAGLVLVTWAVFGSLALCTLVEWA